MMKRAVPGHGMSLIMLVGFLMTLACASGLARADVITRVSEIRTMTQEEAAKNVPVKVRGVVTWCYPRRLTGGLMIDQNGAGVFVVADHDLPDGRKAPGNGVVAGILPGDEVEIEGVTRSSGFAPALWAADIRVVGKASLPSGKELGMGNLLAGNYDSQRVALKGVVTGCRRSDYGDGSWVMVLAGASGKARALIPEIPGLLPEDMEDAGVVVHGVVFTRCNSRKEFVGVSIETNRVEDVEIFKPGGSDPFSVQTLEVGRLRAHVASGYSQHRRRIVGVVTLSKKDLLYLQGPTGGTRVYTRTNQSHSVGEVVEAVGFVESSLGSSQLASSLTRTKSKGAVPAAINVSISQTPDLGNFDGMLVTMNGTVLESHPSQEGIEILVSEGDTSFQAMLPTKTLESLTPGSKVSLTGVAELTYELGPYFPDPTTLSNVRLLLRNDQDIVIHSVPPWWNARRLLIALAIAISAIFLLGWATLLLMRRVRKQANQLASDALAHQQVTAAHVAMMEERSRLAGEMHDGLQPMLSGLSFYLEAADAKLGESSLVGVEEALGRSRTLLGRIREEFRQCIWCLYEMGRQTGGLDNELLRLARVQRQWSHAEINTEIMGEPFPLPASISRGLLLACQEAVENATRHGHASLVEIHCAFQPVALEVVVTDNGCGFDVEMASEAPGSHFGLSGMRQRIERLGGQLNVVSSPDHGTRLSLSVSRESIAKVESNPLVSSLLKVSEKP